MWRYGTVAANSASAMQAAALLLLRAYIDGGVGNVAGDVRTLVQARRAVARMSGVQDNF